MVSPGTAKTAHAGEYAKTPRQASEKLIHNSLTPPKKQAEEENTPHAPLRDAPPLSPPGDEASPARSFTLYRSLLLKAVFFFAPMALLVLLARHLGLEELMDNAWAEKYLLGQGATGVFLYIGATALLTLIGIPRMATAFVGGYVFGPLAGSLYASLGNGISCACSFAYARLVAHRALQKRFGERIRKLDAFLSRNPFSMTIAIRTFPAGLNTLTNLLAGITSIPPLPFIAGSTIGFIPQNLIFALLGSGIKLAPFWRIFTAACLFVASSLLGVWLFRKFLKERKTL